MIASGKARAFGFHAVQLDALPLFKDPSVAAEQLSTTRDFSANFWKGRNLRIRRLNDENLSDATLYRRRNRRPAWTNRLGRGFEATWRRVGRQARGGRAGHLEFGRIVRIHRGQEQEGHLDPADRRALLR